MKKTLIILAFTFIANLSIAQVAIGKETVNGNSTILDFNDTTGNTKGIILPSVNNTNAALTSPTSDNNGTFVFDKSDSKVKMYQNSSWVNLSDAGNSTQITANSSEESTGLQGAIIGADNSLAKGVLVLESTNKAMILPQIANPHLNVKCPYPGMMCYDTVSKSLAVFDGSVWNYWK